MLNLYVLQVQKYLSKTPVFQTSTSPKNFLRDYHVHMKLWVSEGFSIGIDFCKLFKLIYLWFRLFYKLNPIESVHHINTKWTDHHVLLYEDLLKTFIECEIYFILFIIYLAFQKKKQTREKKVFDLALGNTSMTSIVLCGKFTLFFPIHTLQMSRW